MKNYMDPDEFDDMVFSAAPRPEGSWGTIKDVTRTAGTTPGGEKTTASEITDALLKMAEKFSSAKKPAGVDPSWTLTTMLWLEQNYPHYTADGVRGASDRLARSLRRMSYTGATDKGESLMPGEIDDLVERWDEGRFKDLKHWLKVGGYTAAKSIAESIERKKAELRESPLETEKPADVPAYVEPRDELEDIIDAVNTERSSLDPNKGAW